MQPQRYRRLEGGKLIWKHMLGTGKEEEEEEEREELAIKGM